jgi:hypothetical protein
MAASLYAKTYGMEPYEPLDINLNAAPKFLFENNPGDAFFETLRQHQADAIREQSKRSNEIALADKMREAAAIEKIQSLYSRGNPKLSELEQALGESGNVNQAIAMRREAMNDARADKYYEQQDDLMELRIKSAKQAMLRNAARSMQQGEDLMFFWNPATKSLEVGPKSSKSQQIAAGLFPLTEAKAVKLAQEYAANAPADEEPESKNPGFVSSIWDAFAGNTVTDAANAASEKLGESVATRPGPGSAWAKRGVSRPGTTTLRIWRD